MMKLSPGEVVRLKSGGTVMTVEADRGNSNYTFTWMDDKGAMQSNLLPASAVDRAPVTFRTLLKKQKQEVFDAILAGGFDPNQFSWKEVRSSEHQRPDVIVSKLVYSPEFFFLFNSSRDNSLFFTRSPAGPNMREETNSAPAWIHVLTAFAKWLIDLKQEVGAKDPWEDVSAAYLLASAPLYTTDNSPLTAGEQKRVAESIDELKQSIFERLRHDDERDDQRFTFLVSELESLKESSRRFGKKDFLNLALSASVNIALILASQPETRREILNLALSAFYWLTQNPPHFFPVTVTS